LGIEAGQHDAPGSVDRSEAILWIALVAAGAIDARATPDINRHRRFLREQSRGIPRVIEVRHRHALRATDGFRMGAGFRNFAPIRKGQVMAQDNHGAVLAVEDGLVLLPLYQGKGSDGFFIAREVRPVWLVLSALLRRLRLDRLMRLLPGVRRSSGADVLVADTRIARFYPLEIFHLMGFRKVRRDGDYLVVARRKYDDRRPARIEFPAS
ncbi:MAG TPA: hypothetical protein VD788_09530, partial [Candidatus Polarisedimenticolaceae bacterium]|nr:hypothetical protein [Candidatus Polarisedimenticolaceae bacterium]